VRLLEIRESSRAHRLVHAPPDPLQRQPQQRTHERRLHLLGPQ
jgi:hypothetical protein